MSPSRRAIHFLPMATSIRSSSSIQAEIVVEVTRRRREYHRPSSNFRVNVVSFIEASAPSMLDRPTTSPPQPPLIQVQKESPTGNVIPAKQSVPYKRAASLWASELELGKGREEAPQVRPVRGPEPRVMTPFSRVTFPAPKKSDSFQPTSDLPSNSERHAAAAGAAAGG